MTKWSSSIENDSWRNQCFKFKNRYNNFIHLSGLITEQSSLPSTLEMKLTLDEEILTFELEKFMNSFKQLFDSDLTFLITYKIKEITSGSVNLSLELSGPGDVLQTKLETLNIQDSTDYNYNNIQFEEPKLAITTSSNGNLKIGNYEVGENNSKIFGLRTRKIFHPTPQVITPGHARRSCIGHGRVGNFYFNSNHGVYSDDRNRIIFIKNPSICDCVGHAIYKQQCVLIVSHYTRVLT